MAQRVTGIRSVLNRPAIYDIFRRLIMKRTTAEEIERLYLPSLAMSAKPVRVLDIGCGTGSFLREYGDRPGLEYVGFDPSPEYIAASRAEFGGRGSFLVGTTATVERVALGTFDVVVAKGVQHHLDDAEAIAVVELAATVLKPEGRFVTIDPCFVPKQNPIARFLAQNDRGLNVRTAEGYAALCAQRFASVRTVVHSDWLRVPYNHCVVVATRPNTTCST